MRTYYIYEDAPITVNANRFVFEVVTPQVSQIANLKSAYDINT